MVTDAGHALAAGLGATVDGSALADGDVITYFHIGDLAVKLEVLGDGADYGTGENLAILSYSGIRKDGGVRIDFGVVSDLDIGINESIRPDFNVFAKFGKGAYARQRVNFCHDQIDFIAARAALVFIECPGLYALI
jgi:hypothetical protein